MMKIAVVGSGISGLGASYYLGKRHHVDLYESDTRIGGHTHTHKIQLEEEINVDSGFIVFNDLNYPNLIQFFNELGVICPFLYLQKRARGHQMNLKN